MKVIKEIKEIQEISHWFIVDIGYSNSRKSCGLYTVGGSKDSDCPDTCKDVSFAELEERLVDFCGKHMSANIGLILEAPLSLRFDKNGNPEGRKEFELEKEGQNTTTRYWYCGAGAAVTLAALEFLYKIKNIPDNNIYLFEGFVSFKRSNQSKEPHFTDSEKLYEAIKANDLRVYQGNSHEEGLRYIGKYFGNNIGGTPPVVKITKDGKREIYLFSL